MWRRVFIFAFVKRNGGSYANFQNFSIILNDGVVFKFLNFVPSLEAERVGGSVIEMFILLRIMFLKMILQKYKIDLISHLVYCYY